MNVLTLCRLCGTFPLVKRHFDLSIPWFLYSWSLVTANAVAQAFCIWYDSYENYTTFFAHMCATQRVIRIVCPPVCLFWVARKRRLLAKHVQTLSSVDLVFRKFGANPEEPYRTNHAAWSLPMFIFCSVFENYRRSNVDSYEFLRTMVEHTLSMAAMSSAIMQFVYFVDQVITKFKTLNETLDTFADFTKHNTDAHYLISVSTECLNEAYSSAYFTMVSGLVCMLIVNVYKDASYFAAGWYMSTIEQTLWTAYWFGCVGATVFPAARASTMSSDFNIKLSQLMIDGYSSPVVLTDDESVAHDKLRVHVDFNYVVKFSCGFFDLDRVLIHSILGGICSFSVILVQISAEDDSNKSVFTTSELNTSPVTEVTIEE